ncbi:MAG: hypothetical protein ACJAXX_001259 [Roseivirga sp.]|jgi:hypothetical protein
MIKTTLTCLLVWLSVCLVAQPLEDTIWKVFDSNGDFFSFYTFESSIIYSSQDNIDYSGFAYYYIISESVLAWEKDPSNCPPVNPAGYDYLIENDTLSFSVIEDDCDARAAELPTLVCVNYAILSSTNLATSTEDIKIYPNPTTDIVNIHLAENQERSRV